MFDRLGFGLNVVGVAINALAVTLYASAGIINWMGLAFIPVNVFFATVFYRRMQKS